ncbi:potassium channel family protein [Heyndrickxia vini]|uniref:Potassium channel protein n=1 Tax=Heyndrickxia vini TaxID=1476025 RepID=A0ABX7E479_9BACI|nr:potassium channel family protein [Heyndrickxia vini]QQZ10531.1 potassium channel protein [Heyndrickxia vini]
MFQQFYYRFLRWPVILRILLLAITVIIIFGAAMHFIEPKSFPSIFVGIWWAVITTATVGYGDVYPVTVKGRLLGILLVFIGAGVVSAYFASLAATTVRLQNSYIKGKTMFTGKNHIIIIGWNGRSKSVIEQLLQTNFPQPIVLIDDTLEQNPFLTRQVHFVRGKPYIDEVLKKANIAYADFVLITSDQHKTEIHADMGTILTLLAVKGINVDVYCVVEILTAENFMNAKRGGANEVVQTNMQTSYIMMNSVLSRGMSNTILSMMDHLNDNHLKYISIKPEWVGLSFQALSTILQDDRKLLIGLKTGEDTMINPPLYRKITNDDELLVISK